MTLDQKTGAEHPKVLRKALKGTDMIGNIIVIALTIWGAVPALLHMKAPGCVQGTLMHMGFAGYVDYAKTNCIDVCKNTAIRKTSDERRKVG